MSQPRSRRVLLDAAALSDTGRERTKNDDSFLLETGASRATLGVCDGMGGHVGGDVASRLAVEAISKALAEPDAAPMDERLRRAISAASRHVLGAAGADPALRGMGTTATIAALEGSELVIAQVGDSRAYLFRDSELTRLTRDQTLAQALADQGQLSPEEVESCDFAHVILEAVGVRELPQVDVSRVELRTGDVILVCSDGLSGPLGDAELARLLAEDAPAEQLVRRLVDEANSRGGPDNITCIVARVLCVTDLESDEPLPALPLRRFWRWS